jgi:metallo-beta-lactamase class B
MLRLFAVVSLMLLPLSAQKKDNEPFPAYKIIGNVYYVGANDITSYLITTPQGHFLVNEGYENTPPLIKASVEKLGFKMTDIKYLLNGQAHSDHIAGQALLKEWTGAQVISSEADAVVVEGGGKGDFRFEGISSYPPVKVSRRIKDGDTVTLGSTTLVAHLTPGHTKGCTTWTVQTTEGGKKYDVVIVGGTTINPGVVLVNNPKYPQIAEDYARTWRVMRALKCDVFLGAHGGYYGMTEKYERMVKGERPNPFIDPEGYAAFINRSEKAYLDQLNRERAVSAR